MEADIGKLISQAVKKLQADPALLKKFSAQPVKALEQLLGTDLPDAQIQPVIDGIKAKLAAGDLSGKMNDLGKLFK